MEYTLHYGASNCIAILCLDKWTDTILLFYLQARHWSQLLNENTTTNFIKLTTAFIIIRLGKGMAMSMVLLTFTLQFNHLEPTYGYVALTLLYFILTQYKGMFSAYFPYSEK